MLIFCQFVRVDGALPVVVNADEVRFVRSGDAEGTTTILFDEQHRIVVQGTLNDVVDRLRHRT